MSDDFTPENLRAVELLRQLAALSPATDPTGTRITIRTATGRFVGEALLSAEAADLLAMSLESMNGVAATDPNGPGPGPEFAPLTDHGIELDAEYVPDGLADLDEFLAAYAENGQDGDPR